MSLRGILEEREMKRRGWTGIDFDGTLAFYDHWRGPTHVGPPIKPMVDRVKALLAAGHEVRIFTARVATSDIAERDLIIRAIEDWCIEHIGQVLAVTCIKDMGMVRLFDDRAIQVETNTGRLIGELADA